MPDTFRLASYNVENLFHRAKVLNLRDASVGDDILDKIGELQKLLKKATYTAAIKGQILALFNELKPYIEIQEDRGKLFTGQGAAMHVTASGADAWDGEIAFKHADFSELNRDNTAKVIKAIKADVMWLVEVESRSELSRFNSQMLDSRFKYNLLIDGNDPRGIDVGLWSRLPLGRIKTHIFDKIGNSFTFSRDCLEIQVELPSGKMLNLLLNHFKSKGFGPQAENDARRLKQAERVKEILQGYDLTTDLVAVCGDFNDTADRAPLQPLVTAPHLHNVLELQFPTDAKKRWTYHFRGEFDQIDYILVSEPLKAGFVKAGVERRGILKLNQLTQGEETEFDTVTTFANAASDHAGIWADFSL